ncbi:MAG: DUF2892 domain-containing protein [Chloroflexi bacterium]|nr:DUF2892 domain-containing protein [Chloroflexota bacterium]
MSFKQNMGTADQLIRILIALAIGGLYFLHILSGPVALVLGIVAVILLVTSLFKFCPLYLPFGLSTRKL